MYIQEGKKIFLTVLILSQQGRKKNKQENPLKSQRKKEAQLSSICTLIVLTRLAVLFATFLADCTKCLLATGFAVFDEAMRQALHRADVCLATIVAADRTCKNQHRTGTMSEGQDSNHTAALQRQCPKPGSRVRPQHLWLDTNKAKSRALTGLVPCNPLPSPAMGCSLDRPGSGTPSGSLGWHGQIELGQRGPADQPGCLDLRYPPGKQPRNGEKKKAILRNHAKSVLDLW